MEETNGDGVIVMMMMMRYGVENEMDRGLMELGIGEYYGRVAIFYCTHKCRVHARVGPTLVLVSVCLVHNE